MEETTTHAELRDKILILMWKNIKLFEPNDITNLNTSNMNYHLLGKIREVLKMLSILAISEEMHSLEKLRGIFTLNLLAPVYNKLKLLFNENNEQMIICIIENLLDVYTKLYCFKKTTYSFENLLDFIRQETEAVKNDNLNQDKLTIYKAVDKFFTAIKENVKDVYIIGDFRTNLQDALRVVNESPKNDLKTYARKLFAKDVFFEEVLHEDYLGEFPVVELKRV